MIQQEKNILRKKMNHHLQQERGSATALAQLLNRIQTLPDWSHAKTILLFAPLFHEPDLLVLLKTPARSFFFPLMQEGTLHLYEWFSDAHWIQGAHSIQEPDPTTWQQRSLAEVDLALIPGLAFDAQGGRLGWGRGYFDRLLGNPTCRALKIGIAWSWQIVPKIPREDHDVKMDFVVTPEKIFHAE